MSDESIKVYVLLATSPYEEHDCPSIHSVYPSYEEAEKARVACYEYTFGPGSAETEAPYGGGKNIDRYYRIEDYIVAPWASPEWFDKVRERRLAERDEIERRWSGRQ